MQNFCTLFNSNYLAKGLVMYDSLRKFSPSFHLYIFAFDDISNSILSNFKLEYVTIITLAEFEDNDLLKVKPTRTVAEYCWTCTSSTILYCLKNYKIEDCTYIDADLFFFGNPKVLIDEMGNKDVLLTSHRYTPIYDQSENSGEYCVQFMCFKNTKNGMKILGWWRNECLKWCYNRLEDGKFGDQMYLNDWTTRFEGIHVLNNIGGSVAPWNVQQYNIFVKNEKYVGVEIETKKPFELIFYHFHNLKNHDFIRFNEFIFGHYLISKSIRKIIYRPYIDKLKQIDRNIKLINSDFDSLGSLRIDYKWYKLIAHFLKNFFKNNKIIWLRK